MSVMKETKKLLLRVTPKKLKEHNIFIKRKDIEKIEVTPYLKTMKDGSQNYCYKVTLNLKCGGKISFKYENETNTSGFQILKNVCVYF